jgi:hypothetical protein
MKVQSILSVFSAAAIAASLTFVHVAHADVPQTLTHQGRLYDAKGVPIASVTTMEFRIYDAGGAELWTEAHSVTFDDGYYSLELGSKQPFPADLWGKPSLEIGITIGADPEMTPRGRIKSVPYALVAGDAVGDIHPSTVSIGNTTVIDAQGQWIGDPTGLVGPTGAAGPMGAVGPIGPTGAQGIQGLAGPTGAQGPAGPMGAQGIQGVAGPTGALGPAGPMGAQGVQGVAGPTGAQGPAGPAGTQGPSGFITVLNFEAAWPQALAANTPVVPTTCRTASYTPTTATEVAVIQLSAAGLQTPTATVNYLQMAAAASMNGGTFTFLGSQYNVDVLNVGSASVSTTLRVPLTQGTAYVFGAIFNAPLAVTLTSASCHGTVLIVKP